MSKAFSAEEDEMLIGEVSKYPQLFDHENKDFKNLEIRENIWKIISPTIRKDSKLF